MVLLKDVKVHASIFGAATLAVVAGCIGVAVVAAIEELPFGRTVIALVKGITTHAAIAGENGEFLTEAKRRANRVKSLLDELDAADFSNGSPAFAAVVDALEKLFSLAGRWTQKSWTKKHFGVSVRNGTTSAAHYKAEILRSSPGRPYYSPQRSHDSWNCRKLKETTTEQTQCDS